MKTVSLQLTSRIKLKTEAKKETNTPLQLTSYQSNYPAVLVLISNHILFKCYHSTAAIMVRIKRASSTQQIPVQSSESWSAFHKKHHSARFHNSANNYPRLRKALCGGTISSSLCLCDGGYDDHSDSDWFGNLMGFLSAGSKDMNDSTSSNLSVDNVTDPVHVHRQLTRKTLFRKNTQI
jgi:hypothetical protein